MKHMVNYELPPSALFEDLPKMAENNTQNSPFMILFIHLFVRLAGAHRFGHQVRPRNRHLRNGLLRGAGQGRAPCGQEEKISWTRRSLAPRHSRRVRQMVPTEGICSSFLL